MSTNRRVASRRVAFIPRDKACIYRTLDIPNGDRSIRGKSVISPELYRIRGTSVAISGVWVGGKKKISENPREARIYVRAPVSVKRNLIRRHNTESIRSNRVSIKYIG